MKHMPTDINSIWLIDKNKKMRLDKGKGEFSRQAFLASRTKVGIGQINNRVVAYLSFLNDFLTRVSKTIPTY